MNLHYNEYRYHVIVLCVGDALDVLQSEVPCLRTNGVMVVVVVVVVVVVAVTIMLVADKLGRH